MAENKTNKKPLTKILSNGMEENGRSKYNKYMGLDRADFAWKFFSTTVHATITEMKEEKACGEESKMWNKMAF